MLRRSKGTRGGGAVAGASGAGLGQRGRARGPSLAARVCRNGAVGSYGGHLGPRTAFRPVQTDFPAIILHLTIPPTPTDLRTSRDTGNQPSAFAAKKQSKPAPETPRSARGASSGVARTLLQTRAGFPHSHAAPARKLGRQSSGCANILEVCEGRRPRRRRRQPANTIGTLGPNYPQSCDLLRVPQGARQVVRELGEVTGRGALC